MCPGGTKSCTEAGNSHTSSTSHGRKTLLIPSSGSNYPPPVHRIFCHYTDRLLKDRDRFCMAMLRPLGIEKGQPFKPDERQKKILTEGAFVGEAMAKADSFDM